MSNNQRYRDMPIPDIMAALESMIKDAPALESIVQRAIDAHRQTVTWTAEDIEAYGEVGPWERGLIAHFVYAISRPVIGATALDLLAAQVALEDAYRRPDGDPGTIADRRP